ncbi:hypothetical protein GCM10029978_047730 [Actinoallomurus acanthiterrae]
MSVSPARPTAPLPGPDARILFASVPSSGPINPLLAMARELNERGVPGLWFASGEERRADIERIPGHGTVRFASYGPSKPELDPAAWDDATIAAMSSPSLLRNLVAFWDTNTDHAYAARQYERALAVVDEVRPDFAVIDLCTPWAIDAAAKRGVPYLLSVPVPVSAAYMDRLSWSYPTPFSGLPRRMTPRQRVRNVAFRLGAMGVFARPRMLLPAVAATRRRKALGIANPSGAPSRYADGASAVLGYSVFGMEYPFQAAPDHLKMVGAVVTEEAAGGSGDDELDAWLDSHDSVVYIGFGTVMRTTRRLAEVLLEAARRLGPDVGVLWKLAGSARECLPDELPPNIRLVEWVPSQLGVLAHPNVRVFFNHGGGNAVHEGLMFGKPGLALPFWMDCHDVAARLVDSGAGLAVRREPDADEVVAKLSRLLTDDRFTERARLWSARLRAAGGVSRAADIAMEQWRMARASAAKVDRYATTGPDESRYGT